MAKKSLLSKPLFWLAVGAALYAWRRRGHVEIGEVEVVPGPTDVHLIAGEAPILIGDPPVYTRDGAVRSPGMVYIS